MGEGVIAMGKSAIGWTEETWNPVTGCSHVSEGCRHCYAELLSRRKGWSRKAWTARHAAENVVLHPDRLGIPLSWQKPRMVFCSESPGRHPIASNPQLAVLNQERKQERTTGQSTRRKQLVQATREP